MIIKVDNEVIELTDEDREEVFNIARSIFDDLPLEERTKLDYSNWSKGFVTAMSIARHAKDKGWL